MKRLAVFIVIIVDLAICWLLFNNRLFSHLVMWNIVESGKKEDFYFSPESGPKFAKFEPDNDALINFRQEVYSLSANESDDFKRALIVARYVKDVFSANHYSGKTLKWDSPLGILRQARQGARGVHCFHQSILFSTYLSSLGLKSRLWALEGDRFDGNAHSINEVYIKGLKKWVFIDVLFGFYVTEKGILLSLLELRDKLLGNSSNTLLFVNIQSGSNMENDISGLYSKLIKDVFLRTANDYVNKYSHRYGFLSMFSRQIDYFPNDIRIGLDYLLSGRDIFVYYLDNSSRSLKIIKIAVKSLFYFFIFSLAVIIAVAIFHKYITKS